MNIETYIAASNRAGTVAELFSGYRAAMAARGFDRIVFSLLTDHAAIGRKAGHGILFNYPDNWMKVYAAKRYETIDPVRRYIPAAEGAFSWESLRHKQKLTREQNLCLHEAAEAGLKDGIGIPLRGPQGALAGIGAASSSGGVDLNDDALSHATLLARQFYGRFLALERKPQQTAEIVLSKRELEVLKYCALGKSRQETSRALGISKEAVKFHIRNVRRKLGASNALAAILKALNTGMIQI